MLVTHDIQGRNAASSSSLPGQMRSRTSRGFSAQGYPPHQGDPAPWGGQSIDNLTGGQKVWSPYELVPPNPAQGQYSGNAQQVPDLRMGSATHLPRQKDDEGRSLATAGWPRAQYDASSRPQRWDSRQAWEGYSSQQVEEYAMGIPGDIHQSWGSACKIFSL
jgi:hypothetical protein